MTPAVRAATAVAVCLATWAGGTVAARAGDRPVPVGPGLVTVEVGIRHSRFEPDTIGVRPGTTVRFEVRNDDPIGHELVVGDRSVHERHEAGSEGEHPPVPGEVSVAPGDTGVTFLRFDEPGRVEFACHLPGHLAYGMTGTVVVG